MELLYNIIKFCDMETDNQALAVSSKQATKDIQAYFWIIYDSRE